MTARARPARRLTALQRGNGVGVLLSGIATLILIVSLITPWWTNAGYDSNNGDTWGVNFLPGSTFTLTCVGGGCPATLTTDTYASNGLLATGVFFGEVEGGIAIGLCFGVASFLAGLIAFVDRGRLGAVRTAMGAGLLAGSVALIAPVAFALTLPGALSVDGGPYSRMTFSGGSGTEGWGPGAGWLLALVAFVLFLAAAISQWSTLRYARPWDTPFTVEPPEPSDPPIRVTTPPDRLLRLDQLRNQGTITEAEWLAHRHRILVLMDRSGPAQVHPNEGTRQAARAHIDALRASGSYAPEQLRIETAKVLKTFGLSDEFLFPEEEIPALLVRQRAGLISPEEFERRKQELLDQV